MARSTENLPKRSFLERIKGSRGGTLNFKVVALGSDGVGKTALLVRCLSNEFYHNYISEPEKTYHYSVKFKRNKVTYDIIETRGKNNAIVSHADAVIIVFSITDLQSYQHAKELVGKVKELTFQAPPIIMIANKTDKGNQRCVAKEDYEEFCEEEGIKMFELSAALFTTTLDVAFEEIYRQLYLSNTLGKPKSTSASPLMKRKHHKHLALKEMSRSLREKDFHKLIVHARPESTFTSMNDERKLSNSSNII